MRDPNSCGEMEPPLSSSTCGKVSGKYRNAQEGGGTGTEFGNGSCCERIRLIACQGAEDAGFEKEQGSHEVEELLEFAQLLQLWRTSKLQAPTAYQEFATTPRIEPMRWQSKSFNCSLQSSMISAKSASPRAAYRQVRVVF